MHLSAARPMFVPLLDQVPEAIDIEEDGCDYSALVPIARCTATDRIVSIECALSYTTNSHARPVNSWFHEFSFSIGCASLSDEEPPFFTQDRNIASQYIPPAMRPLIMPVVLECCTALILRVRPRALYRVTKMRRPTPAALEKHHRLTARLRELGYSIYETGTDPFDRMFWVMALV